MSKPMSAEGRARDVARDYFNGDFFADRAKLLSGLVAAAIQKAEAAERERCAAKFERLAEIVKTPANRVSDADKEFYSQVAELFEPIGRSVLPNWKAIAAAIRTPTTEAPDAD